MFLSKREAQSSLLASFVTHTPTHTQTHLDMTPSQIAVPVPTQAEAHVDKHTVDRIRTCSPHDL